MNFVVTIAVFAILLAPFFLLLALLRFVPPERRRRIATIKPLRHGKTRPKLAALIEAIGGLF
jgi:hypothetical protein